MSDLRSAISDLLSVFNTLDHTSTLQDMMDLLPILSSMTENYFLWAPAYKLVDKDPREIRAKLVAWDAAVVVSADMTCFAGRKQDVATFIHTVARDAQTQCIPAEIDRAYKAKILPMVQLDTIRWIFK